MSDYKNVRCYHCLEPQGDRTIQYNITRNCWTCPDCSTENPISDIDKIVEDRGANYGPPIHHFACTRELHLRWIERRILASKLHITMQQESALSHGVYMIFDKLTRAAENPLHMDNWDDIEGYVKCIRTILESDISIDPSLMAKEDKNAK